MTKLTVRDIFDRLDFEAAGEVYLTESDLIEQVGLSMTFGSYDLEEADRAEFEARLKGYYVIKWICTDSWVGAWAVYLDGQPLALGHQTARKNGVNYKFVSKEAVDRFRAFIFDYASRVQKIDLVEYIDLDSVFDDGDGGTGYSVAYAEQLLTDQGFYKGEPVTVVEKYSYSSSYHTVKPPTVKAARTKWGKVKVQKASGEILLIDLEDFRIPYPLKA